MLGIGDKENLFLEFIVYRGIRNFIYYIFSVLITCIGYVGTGEGRFG